MGFKTSPDIKIAAFSKALIIKDVLDKSVKFLFVFTVQYYRRYVLCSSVLRNKCFSTRERRRKLNITKRIKVISPATCSSLLKTSSIKPLSIWNENVFHVCRKRYKSWAPGAEKLGFNAHGSKTTTIAYKVFAKRRPTSRCLSRWPFDTTL